MNLAILSLSLAKDRFSIMLSFIVCVLFVGLVTSQDAANEVAFSAGLTHDLTLLHAETVVYDRIFTNIGSSYNATSGVFTCNVPGLYVFQFHTLAHQDKSTWLELYKNSDYIASVFGHTANDYASAGNSVVLQLAQGDQVYVKAVDNSYGTDTNIYGQPDEVYSTFSGYLLRPLQN